MRRTKIALIGEDPNDTKAIKHLMNKKFEHHFKTISKNQTGSKMFNKSAVNSYNIELSSETYNCVIVIVDADAIITETNKIQEKKNQYIDLAKKLDCNSLLLLNVYELEALILADIESLNNHYRTNVSFKSNVTYQQKPKEHLQKVTAEKYKVSDAPALFQSLNFDTVRKNCSYFNDFITNFEKAINS